MRWIEGGLRPTSIPARSIRSAGWAALLASLSLLGAADCQTPGDGGDGDGDGDDCVCIEIYAPVCGDDGVTYGNECKALCEGVTVAYPGECQEPPTCEGYECPEGQHCELVEVQCITVPCFPQPTCVPNDDEEPADPLLP